MSLGHLGGLLLIALALPAQDKPPACESYPAGDTVILPHQNEPGALSLDPAAPMWRTGVMAKMDRLCQTGREAAGIQSEVRAFWTDSAIYFLFICPYKVLNLFTPPQPGGPRNKLWDRDVVEIFLGSDWEHTRRYREFEIAPTGDWIDLAIDLDRRGPGDRSWRSGWTTAARIDSKRKVWYAAARIPLSAVSDTPVVRGSRWRGNLYRIDGEGPDAMRSFLCWRPSCVTDRDPNHVPERFGTFVFQ